MKILDYMIKQRNGHYCHVLELTDVYDLECVIESFIMDLGEQFTLGEYLDFFNSIEIYFIADDTLTSEQNDAIECELYDADISELVKEACDGM